MNRLPLFLQRQISSFRQDEGGSVTIEFLVVFQVFLLFFLMTYENGVISIRHVMLERGVDLAVRDVRIGNMPNPTRDSMRERICDISMIIPDCENQLQIEMVRRNPRSWNDLPSEVRCIDRSTTSQPVVTFTNGGNNELMIMRACVRIDPMLPTSGIGKAIAGSNSGAAAGGSYALVATAAFVVEPFSNEE